MSSSNQGNMDSPSPVPPSEDALVFPPDAAPSDDAPTIITRNRPDASDLSSAITSDGVAGLRGRKLAHFELLAAIGVGGMAAVLRARDTQLDRFVALKILPPALAADPENVRRFHQEARAAAKLDHENIARVFYCGEDQKLHFIAFEFVEGENLRVLLERRGRLPVGEAIRYTLQVAAGLEHAAARGIVHRDVKPSNILITPTGRAKLVDMGLARSIERKGDQDLTQSGITLGTFDYMSPEQSLEPRDADTRSDIYSLGCTLYHMLTGRPPVPEGAAGKKMYFHQHMMPADPRELNADIPDEVVRILSRMMAKDPGERYQRPVELVQHLLQVAARVGAADDVPEGVLFVDGPTGQQARPRPLAIISIAVSALAAVLVAVSLVPPETTAPPRAAPEQRPTAQPVVQPNPERVTPAPPSAAPLRSDARDIASENELQELLQAKSEQLAGTLHGSIDITGKGLVFKGGQGRRLELESTAAAVDDFAVLRFEATRPGAAGLTLQTAAGGSVTLRRLRIELAAQGNPAGAAAIVVTGSGRVTFEDCVFVQVDVPVLKNGVDVVEQPLVASVLIEPAAGAEPLVVFNQCLFQGERTSLPGDPVAGGQAAIAVRGAASLSATDCAFRPHNAFVHIRAGSDPFRTPQVALERCSGFVVNGPAFLFDKNAECRLLRVRQCIFSRPEGQKLSALEPDLIRQASDANRPSFDGADNCYHFLNALWARPGKTPIVAYEEFRRAVRGGDNGSEVRELGQSPWASSQPLEEASPAEAFRVYKSVAGRGIESCAWGRREVADDPVVAVTDPDLPPGRTYKIVDENAKGGANVFKNLSAALASADDGDTILLKQTPGRRALELSPAALDPRRLKNVTLRPYPKHQPTLMLDPTVRTRDVALFHVPEGSLTIEELHIVLEPEKKGFSGRSIVQLGDGAHCVFKDCVITLRPPSLERLPMRVAALDDPERVMKMGGTAPATRAQLRLTNCFVRGEGDLIDVTSGRAVDVIIDNCLIALTGSLLHLQAAEKEASGELGIQLTLTKVSAFVAEPILTLHGGKANAPVAVKADNCLFASLSERNLVMLESAEALSEESLRRQVDWKGRENCYANFGKLFEHQQRPAAMLENLHWKEVFPDSDSRHEQLIFPLQLLETPSPLWEARPELFRPTDAGADFTFGAALDLGPLLPAETRE